MGNENFLLELMLNGETKIVNKRMLTFVVIIRVRDVMKLQREREGD